MGAESNPNADSPPPLIVLTGASDLAKPSQLHRILAGAGILIHLAYHRFPLEFPHGYPGRAFDEHILLNRRVFQAACEAGVKKIIFSSSIQVVARWTNIHPRSRTIGTAWPSGAAKKCWPPFTG